MAMRPVPGMYPVTQNYADDATIYNYGAGHGAVDYGVPVGTPVVAAESGTVIFADWVWNLPGGAYDWEARDYQIKPAAGDIKTGGGIMVALRNEVGSRWWKAHLSRTDLNPGDYVTKGQIIGYSGSTGSSTGPHLHMSLVPPSPNWNNGYFGSIDPAPYITEAYAPTTATTWVGSPTTGTGATTEDPLDWSTMSQADFNNLMDGYFTARKGQAGTLAWTVGNDRDRGVNMERTLNAVAKAVSPDTLRTIVAQAVPAGANVDQTKLANDIAAGLLRQITNGA